MNVDFPTFLAALTVFAIVVAWLAATAITRLQTRSKGPTKTEKPAIARPPAPFTGRVWVVDGDTIRVGKHRVRLFGMDAPEMDQRGGAKAKSNPIRLAGGADVQVEPLTMDCYGRGGRESLAGRHGSLRAYGPRRLRRGHVALEPRLRAGGTGGPVGTARIMGLRPDERDRGSGRASGLHAIARRRRSREAPKRRSDATSPVAGVTASPGFHTDKFAWRAVGTREQACAKPKRLARTARPTWRQRPPSTVGSPGDPQPISTSRSLASTCAPVWTCSATTFPPFSA